jgi:predicted metallo-beta-lactamase superfamily hydrolase
MDDTILVNNGEDHLRGKDTSTTMIMILRILRIRRDIIVIILHHLDHHHPFMHPNHEGATSKSSM